MGNVTPVKLIAGFWEFRLAGVPTRVGGRVGGEGRGEGTFFPPHVPAEYYWLAEKQQQPKMQ